MSNDSSRQIVRRRLGTRRWRHSDVIEDVAISTSGSLVASASWDQTVCVWDVSSGEMLHRVDLRAEDEYSENYCVKFSPNEKLIAHGGIDCIVRLFDLETGEIAQPLGSHDGIISCLAFAPDSRSLASASGDSTVRVWDLTTKAEIFRFSSELTISDIQFSGDGSRLAFCDKAGRLYVYDFEARDHNQTVNVADSPAIGLSFSPDGDSLAVGIADGRVFLLNLKDMRRHKIRDALSKNQLTDVEFSPNGRWIAVAEDRAIRIADAKTGAEVRSLDLLDWSTRVAFSSGGKYLVAGSHDCKIRIWNVASGQQLNADNGIDNRIAQVCSVDDVLLSTSHDKTTRLWNIDTGEQTVQRRWDGNLVSVADLSPDRRSVAIVSSTSGHSDINIWDPVKDEVTAVIRGHETTVCSVAFSPDGSLLATGDKDGQVLLWRVGKYEVVSRISCEAGHVSLAFSASSKQLAIATNQTVEIWNYQSRQCATRLHDDQYQPIGSIVWSSDEQLLACVRPERPIAVWNPVESSLLKRVEGGERILCTAFSPDGQLMAAGGGDSDVRVWSTTHWNQVLLSEHDGEVASVVFSNSGRHLISGGHDTTLAVWDVSAIAKSLQSGG